MNHPHHIHNLTTSHADWLFALRCLATARWGSGHDIDSYDHLNAYRRGLSVRQAFHELASR